MEMDRYNIEMLRSKWNTCALPYHLETPSSIQATPANMRFNEFRFMLTKKATTNPLKLNSVSPRIILTKFETKSNHHLDTCPTNNAEEDTKTRRYEWKWQVFCKSTCSDFVTGGTFLKNKFNMGITNCRQRQIDGDCQKIEIILTRRKNKK